MSNRAAAAAAAAAGADDGSERWPRRGACVVAYGMPQSEQRAGRRLDAVLQR